MNHLYVGPTLRPREPVLRHPRVRVHRPARHGDLFASSIADGDRIVPIDGVFHYALQHFGKHLLEKGDLVLARSHLREALRLRIAKRDTGLVQSTQSALDRVEARIGQTVAGLAAGRE
ncbi:hypothetical protein [Kitasatospora sp. NPDC056273]|uniref:hypothetical protein n=1 Tax=Kitasatospora sp. NPDC056273 TaxID=3345769 RepID=UPI0035D63F9F